MAVKIAINGFGRIGRQAFKASLNFKGLEVVAINDLMEIESMAYLLKYDSVYGKLNKKVEHSDGKLIVNGKVITVTSEPKPEKLPWKKLGVDIVLECTGFFDTKALSAKHLKAGAKKVIISTNSKDDITPLVLGVNEDVYDPKKDHVLANGSCTTNALAPIVKVLEESFKIERSLMTTIHSYTSTQSLVDGPSGKDFRRGRSACLNMVLTSTGAAKSTNLVLPQMKNIFDGRSLRVPTATVSLIDMTAVLSRDVTVDEVNNAFIKSAKGELKGNLGVTDEALVSTDLMGDTHLSVVDLQATMTINNLVKVYAWYDNEYGYAHGLVKMAEFIGKKL